MEMEMKEEEKIKGNQMEEKILKMREFIQDALKMKYLGNRKNYDYMINQLHNQSEDSTKCIIYHALSKCVTIISQQPHVYEDLVNTTFRFQWNSPTEVYNAFQDYILHLVSSNGTYILPTIRMLVKQFLPSKAIPQSLKLQSEEAYKKTFELRVKDIHHLLQKLAAVVPLTVNIIFPVLKEFLPHKRRDAYEHVSYIKSLLKILSYIPSIEESVVALIVDSLVAVDVEIKLDESEEDLFTLDDFLDDANDDPNTVKGIDEMADKLDEMMLLVFEYMEEYIVNDEKHAKDFFYALLKAFDKTILHTHQSKYPQFLIFYLSDFNTSFQESFITQLIAAILDYRTPPVMKQNCACYLASFVARAKNLSTMNIRATIIHLCNWLHQHVEDENASKTSSIQSMFALIFQTMCYILCFRSLDLSLSGEDGIEFLNNLYLGHLISSSYDPMAYCIPSIAMEFYHLIELFQLVSLNELIRLEETIMDQTTDNNVKCGANLEHAMKRITSKKKKVQELVIFPFDPFLLRRCYKYIEPRYVYWKHVDPSAPENENRVEQLKAVIQDIALDMEEDTLSIASSFDNLKEEHGFLKASPASYDSSRETFFPGFLLAQQAQILCTNEQIMTDNDDEISENEDFTDDEAF